MFRLLGSYPLEWFNKGYPAKGETAHLDARETAIRWNLAPWGFFWREDQAKNLGL